MNGPNIRRKRRPKREVQGGFKMSYRYKYYMKEDIVEEDEEELEWFFFNTYLIFLLNFYNFDMCM